MVGQAMRRVYVDPEAPQRDALQEAAKWIRYGGLVVVPTDTLYGLAADPYRASAIARLFAAKRRAASQPLPLIAADAEMVEASFGRLPPDGRRLARRFWPGPLTLLVPAPVSLDRQVVGGTGRVGVRVPAHDIARAICRFVGHAVTATSANRSGEQATADPDVVERTLGAVVDLLIDAGPTPGGAPSTIVDLTEPAPVLVRAGAIGWDDIEACLNIDRED